MTTDVTLISFSVCPFAQRSRVVMAAKGIVAETVYIDLDNKPDWFLDRVPTGKVPALSVGERTLFESAAINEYLDEISTGNALGATPLERAEARAWIALTDDAVMAQYRALVASSEAELAKAVETLAAVLVRLEPVAAGRADAVNVSLLDAAIAPVFTRNAVVPEIEDRLAPQLGTEMMRWRDRLLAHPAVAQSVAEDFAAELQRFFLPRGSYALAIEATEPAA